MNREKVQRHVGKAEQRVDRRRLDERTDCDLEERVEMSDRLAIACRVRDLSPRGFKIQVD